MSDATCSVDGCEAPRVAKGKCKKHYLADYYVATKERDKAKRHNWYIANAETVKERAKISGPRIRANNPDHYREYRRRYLQANLERHNENQKRRLQRLANADNRTISEADWHRLLLAYNGRCAYCGSDQDITRDHVIPISRGGRDSIGNVLPACSPCNLSKGTKFLIEWRIYRRKYRS